MWRGEGSAVCGRAGKTPGRMSFPAAVVADAASVARRRRVRLSSSSDAPFLQESLVRPRSLCRLRDGFHSRGADRESLGWFYALALILLSGAVINAQRLGRRGLTVVPGEPVDHLPE